MVSGLAVHRRVQWPQTYRIIRSIHPPVDLFEDIGDPKDWEALVSVEEHPFGTVFGIGDGIRHRAGGGGSLGVEIAFGKSAHVDWVAVGGSTVTVWTE